jgi:hypothetical protein
MSRDFPPRNAQHGLLEQVIVLKQDALIKRSAGDLLTRGGHIIKKRSRRLRLLLINAFKSLLHYGGKVDRK